MLINFTMGLIGALVAFIWYLWDVIRAYQVPGLGIRVEEFRIEGSWIMEDWNLVGANNVPEVPNESHPEPYILNPKP